MLPLAMLVACIVLNGEGAMTTMHDTDGVPRGDAEDIMRLVKEATHKEWLSAAARIRKLVQKELRTGASPTTRKIVREELRAYLKEHEMNRRTKARAVETKKSSDGEDALTVPAIQSTPLPRDTARDVADSALPSIDASLTMVPKQQPFSACDGKPLDMKKFKNQKHELHLKQYDCACERYGCDDPCTPKVVRVVANTAKTASVMW
jgi:hypothetical protein